MALRTNRRCLFFLVRASSLCPEQLVRAVVSRVFVGFRSFFVPFSSVFRPTSVVFSPRFRPFPSVSAGYLPSYSSCGGDGGGGGNRTPSSREANSVSRADSVLG